MLFLDPQWYLEWPRPSGMRQACHDPQLTLLTLCHLRFDSVRSVSHLIAVCLGFSYRLAIKVIVRSPVENTKNDKYVLKILSRYSIRVYNSRFRCPLPGSVPSRLRYKW